MSNSAIFVTMEENTAFARAALWQGVELMELYRREAGAVDWEGAIVKARLARLLKGEQAGFADAGLPQLVYVEKLGTQRAGDHLTVEITANPRHGKAYSGQLVDDSKPATSPPEPWQRALKRGLKLKAGKIVCDTKIMAQQCSAWLDKQKISQSSKINIVVDPAAIQQLSLDEISETLGVPRVLLPSGGEIVIESTEALTAIDVNRGLSGNALTTNIEAVREAARQIRLRDICGIIIIDILKINARTDVNKLFTILRQAGEMDFRPLHVFGLSKLGLIEIVRSLQK